MATTKLDLTNTNNIEQTVTATPTASSIPIADGSGKLDEGWLQTTDANVATLTDGSDADSLHTHKFVEKLILSPGATTVGNTTTETALITATLSGGELSTNNGVRITLPITTLNTDVAIRPLTIRLKYGGTTVNTITVTPDAGGFNPDIKGTITATLFANSSTSSQSGVLTFEAKTPGLWSSGSGDIYSDIVTGTASEDSTGDLDISVTAQWAGAFAGDTVTVYNGSIEIIK